MDMSFIKLLSISLIMLSVSNLHDRSIKRTKYRLRTIMESKEPVKPTSFIISIKREFNQFVVASSLDGDTDSIDLSPNRVSRIDAVADYIHMTTNVMKTGDYSIVERVNNNLQVFTRFKRKEPTK